MSPPLAPGRPGGFGTYDARAMRILHVAWEYPPVLYGGLGRHVHALANAQARHGHDVVVITQGPAGAGPGHPEEPGPVRVLRAAGGPAGHGGGELLDHVAQMEWAFASCGEELLSTWLPEVVHAHDWMVSHAAVALRPLSGAPLVATIHATEAGRNGGWVSNDLSTTLHSIEWWLANTADAVITCSAAMDREVRTLFDIGPTTIIPNGIDVADWQCPADAAARIRAENADASPLIAYTGRVEWEKGVQTILAAMPALRRAHPGIRLLVAGRGSYLPSLVAQAEGLGLGDSARFLGWVSEEDLRAIVCAADLVIAPSLYEPFGLVALEAAALRAPVVVSRIGGLAEFAANGERAGLFPPGSPEGLSLAIEADLADPTGARARAESAHRDVVERFDWARIAERTVALYRSARSRITGAGADGPGAVAAAGVEDEADAERVNPAGGADPAGGGVHPTGGGLSGDGADPAGGGLHQTGGGLPGDGVRPAGGGVGPVPWHHVQRPRYASPPGRLLDSGR